MSASKAHHPRSSTKAACFFSLPESHFPPLQICTLQSSLSLSNTHPTQDSIILFIFCRKRSLYFALDFKPIPLLLLLSICEKKLKKMVLISAVRDYISRMLQDISGMKVLILDSHTVLSNYFFFLFHFILFHYPLCLASEKIQKESLKKI